MKQRMVTMTPFIIIILLFVTPTKQTWCTTKKMTLSMDEAVKIANQHRPSLQAKQFSVQASKSDEKIALSGYFPTLSINETPFFATKHKSLQNTVEVNATQLIYSFAGPLEQYKIAKKGTLIAKASKAEHKDAIQYEVEAAFLQSWFLQYKNNFIKTLEQSSNKKIKRATHKNKLGLLGKNDWLLETFEYANNTSTSSAYLEELKDVRNELEFLLGKPFGKDIASITLLWDPEKKIVVNDLYYYINIAIKNRKEIKQKQQEIEQLEEYQSFYKKTYLPSLGATANVSRTKNFGTGTGSASSYIGLTLSWNILDGGANYHESNKANANKLRALMEKNHYIQQVKYEVERAYNQLAIDLKKLVALDIQLAQAKNEFNLKKLKRNIGDLSLVEFEQAKHTWETQKLAWIELKVSAAIKKRALIFACGYPQTCV